MSHSQAPPKILLGATALFWGATVNQPASGLVLAILLECPNWIRLRWNFPNASTALAWRVSVLITLALGTLIWLDGNPYTAMARLLIWAPILLFPLQFIQSFGLRDTIALRNLSFINKLKDEDPTKLIVDTSLRINFGNVYFIAALLVSGLGKHAQNPVFFPGLIILVSWFLIARMRARYFALSFILLTAATMGIAGQKQLTSLYKWATELGMGRSLEVSSIPTENKTSIGSLGEIKQSPKIIWRLFAEGKNTPPRLIRTAAYNQYRGVVWRNNFPESQFSDDLLFNELTTIDTAEDETLYLLRDDDRAKVLEESYESYLMRGASATEALFPLPGDSRVITKIKVFGIESNPAGTLRIFPEESVIEGKILRKRNTSFEDPPFTQQDLAVSKIEEMGISEFAKEIGLAQMTTTSGKIARLRQLYSADFEYTRYLNIDQAYASQTRPSAIESFLTAEKRGHCEYFATSAALLLRSVGVPTRYCVGFAVMEGNPQRNEWIVRGTHGHAWVRVWLAEENRWVDFDPTPVGWIAEETGEGHRFQSWKDAFLIAKEDFFLWREDPTNQLIAIAVSFVLGLGVITFILLRLWRSKLIVKGDEKHFYGSQIPLTTALNELEADLEKILGKRATGMTYSHWIIRLTDFEIDPQLINTAIKIHQEIRFDPVCQSPEKRTSLNQLASEIRSLVGKLADSQTTLK